MTCSWVVWLSDSQATGFNCSSRISDHFVPSVELDNIQTTRPGTGLKMVTLITNPKIQTFDAKSKTAQTHWEVGGGGEGWCPNYDAKSTTA